MTMVLNPSCWRTECRHPSPPIPSITTIWPGPPPPSPFNGNWTVAHELRQTQSKMSPHRRLGLVFVTVIGPFWKGLVTRAMLRSLGPWFNLNRDWNTPVAIAKGAEFRGLMLPLDPSLNPLNGFKRVLKSIYGRDC